MRGETMQTLMPKKAIFLGFIAVLLLPACGRQSASDEAESAAASDTAEAVSSVEEVPSEAPTHMTTDWGPDTLTGVYLRGSRYAQFERLADGRLRFYISAAPAADGRTCTLGEQPSYAKLQSRSVAEYDDAGTRLRFIFGPGEVNIQQSAGACQFDGTLAQDSSMVMPDWEFDTPQEEPAQAEAPEDAAPEALEHTTPLAPSRPEAPRSAPPASPASTGGAIL